jgi:hypothetical protein
MTDINRLRRSLRTGGWTGHAANLPSFIAMRGWGSMRELGGLVVRFSMDRDGMAQAYLVDERGGHRLVADQERVYLRREQVQQPRESVAMVHAGFFWPEAMAERVDRLARSTGRSRSHVIRQAVTVYLRSREG